MKPFAILIVLVLTTLGLHAQTEKGKIALGLNNLNPLLPSEFPLLAPTNALGITIGKIKAEDGQGNEEEENFTSVGLEGTFHFFLADNFSAGINLGVFTQNYDDSNLSMFMGGPELRYYFPLKERLKVYLYGNASFGVLNSDGNDEATRLSQFGGGARMAYFIAPNFSLDFGLGYGSWIAKNEYEDYFTGETYDLKLSNSGLVLDLGFAFFFGEGK